MTSEQTAGLERLAGALRASTKPGPVSKDIADAFCTNAKDTAGEFKVIRDNLAQRGTPGHRHRRPRDRRRALVRS